MPTMPSTSALSHLTAQSRFTSPGFLLASVGKVAEAWITEAMAPLDLLPREAAALLVLRTYGAMTQQQLGELLDLDANYLVMVLKKLESRDLVARTRDPRDRRRHVVEITATGSAVRDQVDTAVEQVEIRLLRRLDEDEVDTLRSLLFLVDDVTGRKRRLAEGP